MTSWARQMGKAAHSMMRLGCLQKSRGQKATAFKSAAKAMRILDDIRIDKIAAVVRPAQEAATVRLIKAYDESEHKELKMDHLDRLSTEVDTLIAKIDAALSMRRKHDGKHGDLTAVADAWSSAHTDEEEEEEDDEEGLEKGYSNTWYINTNDGPSERPGQLDQSTHPPSRHKFEALRDKLAAERKVPLSEAMHIARTEFPDVFASYQNHLSDSKVGKAAPGTFEDLVNSEMAKGCNYEVASQRVMQAYGSAALDTRRIAKAELAVDALADAADNIFESDSSLSRCESLRKARLARPDLYRRMR